MNLEINKTSITEVKEQLANEIIKVLQTENNNLNEVSEAEINDTVHQELDEKLINYQDQDALSEVYDTASRDTTPNEAFQEAFFLLQDDVTTLVMEKLKQLKTKTKKR